jgi:hypothetical protein
MGRFPLPDTDRPVLVDCAIGVYSEPRLVDVFNDHEVNGR